MGEFGALTAPVSWWLHPALPLPWDFFFSFGLTCEAAESLQSNTAFQRKCASTLSALHSQWRHHFPVKDLQERENNDGFNASRKAPFVLYGSMLFLTEIDVELYH